MMTDIQRAEFERDMEAMISRAASEGMYLYCNWKLYTPAERLELLRFDAEATARRYEKFKQSLITAL